MARSPVPQASLRQRNVGSKKLSDETDPFREDDLDKPIAAPTSRCSSENDCLHKIALSVITALAFVTRFWGISHPNEVVFDEVHFGKVRLLCRSEIP